MHLENLGKRCLETSFFHTFLSPGKPFGLAVISVWKKVEKTTVAGVRVGGAGQSRKLLPRHEQVFGKHVESYRTKANKTVAIYFWPCVV